MPEEPKGPTSGPEPMLAGPSQRSAPQQVPLDASNIGTVYSNFCHVTFTPEELILDFGLNTQTQPSPSQPIRLTQRVVMNFFTAKRLMQGLQYAVNHYENLFGPIEVDYQRRMRSPSNVRPSPGAGGS